MKIFIVGLMILFIGLILASAIWLYSISKASKGTPIKRTPVPRHAILIMDLQEDFTGEHPRISPPYPETQRVMDAINHVLERTRSIPIPVITIRQEFRGFPGVLFAKLFVQGAAIRGNSGGEWDHRLQLRDHADFCKPIGDAFSSAEFEKHLISEGINELVLVGADAEFCVHLTAQAALNRGYRVKVIKEGLLLRAEKKWSSLMEVYRQEGIDVMTLDGYLNSVGLETKP